MFVLPILIFSIGYNIPRFFELELLTNEVTECQAKVGSGGANDYASNASSTFKTDYEPTEAYNYTNYENCTSFTQIRLTYSELRQNSLYVSVRKH